MKVEVNYKCPGGLDVKLDKKINKAMKNAGFKWYAQGVDFTSGKRDICFDYEPEDGV